MKIADKNLKVLATYDSPHLDKVRVTSFRVVRRVGNKVPPKMFIASLPK